MGIQASYPESWAISIWERLIHQESIGELDLRWVYGEGVELSKLIREVSPLSADSLSEAIQWIEAECPHLELKFSPVGGDVASSISRLFESVRNVDSST